MTVPSGYVQRLVNLTVNKRSTLGPVALGDTSQGILVKKYYATYVGSTLYLGDIAVFTVPGVLDFGICFDTTANVFITYELLDGVYIYWFDPVAAGFRHLLIRAGGTNPWCCLDVANPILVAVASTVVTLDFGGEAVNYVSSDRYTVPHSTGVSTVDKRILRVGMIDDFSRHSVQVG